MRMISQFLLSFCLLTSTGIFCTPAQAVRPMPAEELAIYSVNKKFMLQLVPKSNFAVLGVCHGETSAFDVANSTRLWTVQIYCAGSQVSNDGKTMVVIYPPGDGGTTAIAFYVDGKMLKSYKIKDLPSLTGQSPRLSTGRCWMASDSDRKAEFSPDQSQFIVVLGDKSTAVFATKDGALLSRSKPK